METSLETLAQRAAQGDRDAFSLLVTRVYDRVYAYAIRLTGNRTEAEDLAQDLCAALPVKLRSYRGDAALTTWLYRIAVNAARDRFRRQATHARAAAGWGDWELARQAANAEQADRRDWLTQAMAGLSVDLRETLALVLDGVSHAEAGEVLGVSEGTISWRISEAKKRLAALKQAEKQVETGINASPQARAETGPQSGSDAESVSGSNAGSATGPNAAGEMSR